MTQTISNHPNLEKNLPEEVRKIFKIFLEQGDEIRLVGGCVRDLLIARDVNDFDFATKLLPEEIIKILKKNKIKAIPTGIKFGTITAVINHKNFEITTLRKDLETDGRHCEPEFVDDYFLDAQRRDFTMNALYLDDKGNVTDYFEGITDLKNQEVKFIGDANQRVEEDYLRILRFFRFSCNYAKSLDEEGFAVCISQKGNLGNLSRERIRAEFLKLIASPKRENVTLILQQIDKEEIATEIFSTKFEVKDLERLLNIEEELGFTSDLNLKIATLFLNQITDLKVFCKQICATNKEKRYLQFLLKNISKISQNIELKDLKIMLAFEDKKLIKDLYILSLINHDDTKSQSNLNFLDTFSLPDFPLNGNHMKDLGFQRDEISKALNKAKAFWAANDFISSKNDLIQFLQK